MPAAPDVNRVEYVQSERFAVFVGRNPAVSLSREKLRAAFLVEFFFLREGYSVLDDFVPDPDHIRQIFLFVFSYSGRHN